LIALTLDTQRVIDPFILLFAIAGIVIGLALLAGSFKMTNEWARASIAGLGLSILGLELLAILPSWWLYFSDGRMHWGGQGCVEFNIVNVFKHFPQIFSTKETTEGSIQCVRQALKDTAVVIENGVVLGGFVVGFLIWQKKFPKQLAPGESKPEATGGYK
jgi:hypothetical protein